ncbi:CPBP family intramembrane glutamic endopeptidase [Dielma fastidiosa]|uniref:CPBP family intramembrane glutamic endopeptidase n=1 Tax=Dielma fastidiosa TaxID=1034346 RepID=UPI000E47AFEC|nr:type II CAAX endopeptidase family protein [Dielma fastidiosa]RHN02501.1 CPBP family intramembrane metalloprotease [Dielma fastidiosa]
MAVKLTGTRMDKAPLSPLRCLLLILNYYVGFAYFYPRWAARITLWLNPWAIQTSSAVLFAFYIWMILFSVIVAFPLFKESWQKLPPLSKVLKNVFFLCIIVYLANIGFSLIASMLSGTASSVNQEGLDQSMKAIPLLTAFITVIYAPIVEETLFRGVFFRCCRGKLNFICSMLISGLMFGSIHIYSSLLAGNFTDAWYLLTYAGIGFILCIAYEQNDSIYPSIMLHFMVNLLGTLAMFL